MKTDKSVSSTKMDVVGKLVGDGVFVYVFEWDRIFVSQKS